MKKLFLFLTLFALTFSLNNVANATCLVGDVTTSTACFDGDDKNVSVDVLNAWEGGSGAFNFNDWEYLSKYEISEGLDVTVDIGLVISPIVESNSGAWSFNTDTWDTHENIMIVLKDGVVKSGPMWFAYLLEDECSSGTWTYPEVKDLSHLSVYGRRGDVPVPEPATILLLGSGLVGLAGFGRKKFKK